MTNQIEIMKYISRLFQKLQKNIWSSSYSFTCDASYFFLPFPLLLFLYGEAVVKYPLGV